MAFFSSPDKGASTGRSIMADIFEGVSTVEDAVGVGVEVPVLGCFALQGAAVKRLTVALHKVGGTNSHAVQVD